MKEITEDQAIKSLSTAIQYMIQEEKKHAPTRGEDFCTADDPAHWELARQMAMCLLVAANRDGLNGCRLCRS